MAPIGATGDGAKNGKQANCERGRGSEQYSARRALMLECDI